MKYMCEIPCGLFGAHFGTIALLLIRWAQNLAFFLHGPMRSILHSFISCGATSKMHLPPRILSERVARSSIRQTPGR